jgi:hypothetical protein
MNEQELNSILDKHAKWLAREAGGERANLRGADLRGADLSDATGLPSDPALLRRVCQEALKTGQLEMGRWHTCETTHCLAGWAIHLSGHAGQAMELLLGPATAGALLIPDASHMFDATDESARAWCQKWLEEHPEELTYRVNHETRSDHEQGNANKAEVGLLKGCARLLRRSTQTCSPLPRE